MDGKWGYSTDEEHYHGDSKTKEGAIAEGRAEHPGEEFFVGQYQKVKLAICATQVIEQLSESAYEQAGEAADGWPGATKEQVEDFEERLNDALFAWMSKHGHKPHFFSVASETVERIAAEPEAEAPVVQ